MTTTAPELDGLDCPDPLHRLFNLVDRRLVREWEELGCVTEYGVVMAALELPLEMDAVVVRLLHEAGRFAQVPLEVVLEDPPASLNAYAQVATDAQRLLFKEQKRESRRSNRGRGRGRGKRTR